MANLRTLIPPTSQLAAFDAAARMGSFTRAAEALCISQAAISRMIRELEARLNIKLFTRHRYDVSLTAAGEDFAQSIRPALLRIADAVCAMEDRATAERDLIVYSDMSIDVSYLLPRLRRFLEPHPEIQLNLISSGVPIEQTTVRFHVGFQAGPVQATGFDTVALSDDEIFPVCSPKFLENNPHIVTAQGLVTAPLLHFEQIGRKRMGWVEFFDQCGIAFSESKRRVTFSSYPSLLHAAEQGDGIALGWELSVSSRLDSGSLVRLDQWKLPVRDNLFAYFRESSERRLLAQEFVASLQHRE